MMNKKQSFPSRDDLNEAFEVLQDQITRITVDEEKEMLHDELGEKGNHT